MIPSPFLSREAKDIMKRLLVGTMLCGLALAPGARGQTGSYLGKTYFEWVAGLSSKDAAVRRSAAFALGKMGEGALPALKPLVDRLKDQDAGVRDAAAAAIGDLTLNRRTAVNRVPPVEVLDAVRAALADPDPRVQRSAAYAIGAFGPVAAPAIDSLRGALRHKDAFVRQNAAWALGQVGADGGEGAMASLCQALSDRDPLVRRDAAGALGLMGRPAAANSVTQLLGLVEREKDDVVVKSALEALSRLVGDEHREASTAALVRLLDNPDEDVQRGSAFVLARIGGDKAVPALGVLRKALKDDDVQVQGLAAAALAGIGKEAAPAVPDLAQALRDSKDLIVRRNSALALGHIGPDAKAAVPALADALKASEPTEVRQHAAEALAQIALPHTEEAVPALLEAIRKDPDPLVRQRCVWSLFQFRTLGEGGQKKLLDAARPILSEVLQEKADEHTLVRYDAARLLAYAFREDAPNRTVDVLMDMLNNKDLKVFNSTDARVVGAGNEATGGRSEVKANLGGDARYMAAEALGWLGSKSTGRKDVVEGLKSAARDPDKRLQEAAKLSIERLRIN